MDTSDEGPLDVVIVGGGAAGLAAALQLGRSRRSVVVVDAGEPRNTPAAHMHGYLGHDGLPPGELLARGRSEVERYGGTVLPGTATSLERDDDAFRVGLADGTTLHARRVLVATGLVDELPDIPGVREQWGRNVIHCPYCHGWEVRDQSIVVVATGAMGVHQALLFRQLSERVTVVLHEAQLGPEDRSRLAARDVPVEVGPVAAIAVEGDDVTGVRLGDGRTIDADAVVVAPRFVARAGLLAGVGIEPVPAPMGTGSVVETDARGATTVAGVYAAGNVADVSNQVLQAAAEGSRIGAMINADLVQDDVVRAAAARMDGDDARSWDARYVSRGQRLWSGRPNGALVAEVEPMEPGRALDVGCGEGADAIWLAERGWDVVAVDISDVAIDRAANAGAQAGVTVDWRAVDLTVVLPEPGAHDLVSLQYPALRHDAGDHVIRSIVDAVAPGGTLLVVGHDLAGHHHPHFDPADHVQPPDVAALLEVVGGWVIEVHELREREMPEGRQGPSVPDVVLRARRSG